MKDENPISTSFSSRFHHQKSKLTQVCTIDKWQTVHICADADDADDAADADAVVTDVAGRASKNRRTTAS